MQTKRKNVDWEYIYSTNNFDFLFQTIDDSTNYYQLSLSLYELNDRKQKIGRLVDPKNLLYFHVNFSKSNKQTDTCLIDENYVLSLSEIKDTFGKKVYKLINKKI